MIDIEKGRFIVCVDYIYADNHAMILLSYKVDTLVECVYQAFCIGAGFY